MDEEDRSAVKSFSVAEAIDATLDQTRILLGNTILFKGGIDTTVILPRGRLVEWSAVLQNVFFNAYDSMLTVVEPWLRISTFEERTRAGIVIEDNGQGIDLEHSDSYSNRSFGNWICRQRCDHFA